MELQPLFDKERVLRLIHQDARNRYSRRQALGPEHSASPRGIFKGGLYERAESCKEDSLYVTSWRELTVD